MPTPKKLWKNSVEKPGHGHQEWRRRFYRSFCSVPSGLSGVFRRNGTTDEISTASIPIFRRGATCNVPPSPPPIEKRQSRLVGTVCSITVARSSEECRSHSPSRAARTTKAGDHRNGAITGFCNRHRLIVRYRPIAASRATESRLSIPSL